MNKVVITITGPSASGKSTLEALLYRPEGSIFDRVISHTTRAPRAGEVDGEHYHFISKATFDGMAARGELINTSTHSGNSYGSHVSEFERIFAQQKIALLVCDPPGKEAVEVHAMNNGWASLTVFITNPPSVRYERLVTRFVDEIADLELGGDKMKAKATSFGERLAFTAEVESRWIDDAGLYDLQIDAFNAKNQTAVVNQLSAHALNLMGKTNVRALPAIKSTWGR